jgi:CubicO group peptidase (beta-lactamase class C family)
VSDKAEPDEATQQKAFHTDFLVNSGGESGIQPAEGMSHQIGGESYTWQVVRSEKDIVDFVLVYGEKEYAIAYAWAEIDAPEARSVIMGLGSDDSVKVWLNGKPIHENNIGRPVQVDDDVFAAELKAGKNTLLLKIQNGIREWGFACRVVSPDTLGDKLFAAAGRGDLEKLEMLLSHGVDMSATRYGLTLLNYAKIRGRQDIVDFLIEKGADTNIPIPPKDALVDALFNEKIKGDVPGASVLVAQNGEILYEKGFGYANLEHDIPVAPETKFRIGSITKQFTAAAILKLQEEGKLSVNDPLSKFIPDYPRGDEATIHHLLAHTSGIHSYTNKSDFMKTASSYIEPEELINSFKNDSYDFNPGEQWLYNNSGYFLLGYIVEKVSGAYYAEYLKKTFFEPLDMKDTGIHHWRLILEHEATGYAYENGKVEKAMNWDMSRAGGAGALYSTVRDLYRWNEAVFNGKVLKEDALKTAFTPVKLNNGKEANAFGVGYGYGWMLNPERGLKKIAHGGGLHGFSTYLARYPEQNFTVVVLTNALPPPPSVDPGSLADDIAEIYLWEQMETYKRPAIAATADTSVYNDYVGRYEYPMSAVLIVTTDGDKLFAQLTGQEKFEVFSKANDEFFWKVVDAQVKFVRDETGKVTHAVHFQGGQEFEAPKLNDEIAEVDAAIYDGYVGKYELPNQLILSVTKEDNRLFAQVTGQPKLEVFPRSETTFFWKIVSAEVTFIKDENGKVVKAKLHQAASILEAPKIE